MLRSYSHSIIFTFIFLQPAWASSPVDTQINEADEPSLSVNLLVDGQQVSIQVGQSSEVTVEGKKVQISVAASNEKELQLRHLRFRYPEYFQYEVSFKGDSQVPVRWDLEGHDVDVTVFRVSANDLRAHKNKHPLDDWVGEIVGDSLVTEEATVLELSNVKIPGTKYILPLNLGSIKTIISFSAFEVPGHFGDVRYFLLLSGWDGENPKEERLTRNLLCKSFKVGKEYIKSK